MPRFSLYEDEGVYAVFDAYGPELFFAETRDRAVDGVVRANELAARFPGTLSFGHLREMDGAWRAARGLPPLPEPEAPPVIVAGWLPRRPPKAPLSPPGAQARGSAVPARLVTPESARVTGAVALATQLAAIREAEDHAAKAAAAVDRTVELSASLVRATADAHEPLQCLRTALREVFGERAPAAEAAFRQTCLRDGDERAVRQLREDPRALLPEPRPHSLATGMRVRESAAALARDCTPMIVRLDRVLHDTAAHAGIPTAAALDPVSAARRLHDLLPAQQRLASDALDHSRRLGSAGATASLLRSAWSTLAPHEQGAVRRAAQDVDRLLDAPARRRSPAGPEL